MAGKGRVKEGRSEFGLDGAVSHGWLTYRAVDVAVTVALYGLIVVLPVIVPAVNWARARGALRSGKAGQVHSTVGTAGSGRERSGERLAA